MKISTEAIRFINRHYGSAGDPAPDGVEALVQRIGAQLAAVEETTPFGKRFEEVVVVKVVSCQDHPDADRLHICKIDDGGKVQNVERDEDGHVQIVCGAPNVRAGMLAAWLPPGSTVPSTLDKEPFVLDARAIRGQTSNGMLASPRELTISDNHDGILEIDEELGPIALGTMFVDAFHLRGDAIIDMENKMFTHRPDLFGWLGLARELEGIQHRAYKSPEWYALESSVVAARHPREGGDPVEKENSNWIPDQVGNDELLKIEVKNELPELVPRFTAIAMSDVKIGPSPVWLQLDLARAGLRPINNIVDLTNYLMLLTGQPLHAYDYDKVKARSNSDQATLVVRHSNPGEKIKLLNGKEVEPRAEAIMIATSKELIGVGGVMGGADTEVDEKTTKIILECANFDMYSIRRTAMAHGLFTDAVTRFNKGQSPLQNLAVLAKMVDEVRRHAGGKVASPLIDDNHVPQAALQRGNIHPPVTVTTEFINARLGWTLSVEEMTKLLTNVEFKVTVRHPREGGDPVKEDSNSNWIPDQVGNDAADAVLEVTAPFWRTDIEIAEDVVEEIGRLNGYDKLPLELPRRDLTPATKDALFTFKDQVRQVLSSAGANEVLTYNFVHGNLLDRAGQDRDIAFRLSNALSPDLQYLRLSLTPTLLEKVHPNIKAGHGQFALFEINKVHAKGLLDEEGLPREFNRIALTFAADDKIAAHTYAGAPYYQARAYLGQLLASFGATDSVQWQPLAQADFGGHAAIEQMTKPYEPTRSAVLVKDGLIVGVVGEYRAAVRKALKLPAFTAGFETFHSFLQTAGQTSSYTQLPRFPKVEQDICLKVAADLPYAQLFQCVQDHLQQNRPDQTRHSLEPVDIYQRPDDPVHKQITLRLSLASFDRTLTDQEVNTLLDQVATAAQQTLSAQRV